MERCFLLLNSLCESVPFAIDRKDEKGNITRVLWNSLSEIFDDGSFDAARKENCWSILNTSGHSFGLDHCTLIARTQGRYRVATIAAGQDLNIANLLTSPLFFFF